MSSDLWMSDDELDRQAIKDTKARITESLQSVLHEIESISHLTKERVEQEQIHAVYTHTKAALTRLQEVRDDEGE